MVGLWSLIKYTASNKALEYGRNLSEATLNPKDSR